MPGPMVDPAAIDPHRRHAQTVRSCESRAAEWRRAELDRTRRTCARCGAGMRSPETARAATSA
eukprot:1215889-Prymnesium_polylepis.2